MDFEAGVCSRRERPAPDVVDLTCRHSVGLQIVVRRIHADRQVQPERLAYGDVERRADIHAERRGLCRLPVAVTFRDKRQP